jgi:hypothetical protein
MRYCRRVSWSASVTMPSRRAFVAQIPGPICPAKPNPRFSATFACFVPSHRLLCRRCNPHSHAPAQLPESVHLRSETQRLPPPFGIAGHNLAGRRPRLDLPEQYKRLRRALVSFGTGRLTFLEEEFRCRSNILP